MRKYLQLIFLISVTLSCSITNKRLPSIQNSFKFQSKLDSIYKANPNSIGIMAHIEYPNQNISWSGSVGYANVRDNIKITTNQPFLIASNTKTYVAATILRLFEENKIDIYSSIDEYLSVATKSLLIQGNYDISQIKITHLLSHTSGINDYVDSPTFEEKISSNPNYKWTRSEQIELGVLQMNKLGEAGELYKYSDTNYLLLTEVIEKTTELDFFNAINKLLDFKSNELNTTWFESLEGAPAGIAPLAHQYVGEINLDSYKLDKSFDLYGGGGIASTTKDLSVFIYKLFNNQIFKNPETLNTLLTKIETEKKSDSDYRFGIWKSAINGKTVYGHGGFWGSMVIYSPEIDLSLSIVVLEKDKDYLRKEVAEIIFNEILNKKRN